jgi:aconitate hydratase
MKSVDSFRTKKEIRIGARTITLFSLRALEKSLGCQLSRLPFSLRILLENLLRCEDDRFVRKEEIEKLARWNSKAIPENEIAFMPARVLLQDFTGVPCILDLAVMRDAMIKLGEDPNKINPLLPVDLVIDHSVQVDENATSSAFQTNASLEFERNRERYAFLRWGQQAFKNFRVVPPDTGIVHQVNLEYLARVVFTTEEYGQIIAYPDTLVGTDSHTTMINGLGVLGWGVGGIEAEAAMLGQPVSMLIPQVIGLKMSGALRPGVTATDLVLTVTQLLRRKGVVGKFVEFYGSGLASLSLADRATIANMAPEYGATTGYFPTDAETINFLRLTGRTDEHINLVETYLKEQNLFYTADSPEPEFSNVLELNLATVESSIAGPKRPQDRIPLSKSKPSFRSSLIEILQSSGTSIDKSAMAEWAYYSNDTIKPDFLKSIPVEIAGSQQKLEHGSVVIAAITSCTNTSNPHVLIAAGILAKKAVEKGLKSKPWVKTSFAPGSKVVTEYLRNAGLMESLESLGFHLVGYGCTTCIGNSGTLPETITKAIQENNLVAAAVLSGNRNFEGRINPHTQASYLASPHLVIAYALAGTMDIDFMKEPLGVGNNGEPVLLKDIWPSPLEIEQTMHKSVKPEIFKKEYANIFDGDVNWQSIPIQTGAQYTWDERSTYIKSAPYFENFLSEPKPLEDIHHARVLALLSDSITTDHISPAGSFNEKTPAGRYLLSLGVKEKDFNQYGTRRGNHEIMMRGTFANIRLKNFLVPGIEGGITTLHPSSREPMSIYEAAMKYKEGNIPLIIVAGKEYGSGSSRDWAAKGPALLGVRVVIAESFERIHRSNLIEMGILPLQFEEGQNFRVLDLSGFEVFDIEGIATDLKPRKKITVTAISQDGSKKNFTTICRIDTPNEIKYYKHGGILQYVLRSILNPPPILEPRIQPKLEPKLEPKLQPKVEPKIQPKLQPKIEPKLALNIQPKTDGHVQKYRIIFTGEIEPGQDLQVAKEHLTQILKTSINEVDKLFSGKPVTLNTNLSHSAASEYISELKKIGILSYFEPIQATPPAQASNTIKNVQHPVTGKSSAGAPPHPLSAKSSSTAKTAKSRVQVGSISIARGVVTAAIMIILFVLYPFLILFVANTLFDHIVDNTIFLSEYSLAVGLIAYFLPMFVGIMLLISMLKPFIARPARKEFSIPIPRKKEQALSSYIEKLCISLNFRLKMNIEVDCSTNVTLRYKKGFIGFLGNNLMLTIGLPVISETTMAEFASVISCELGNFTKRTRMYIYLIITGINGWFTRVVFDEDQTDQKMTILSTTSGGFVAYLAVPIAKLFIWLTRKIIALFMIIGEIVSKPYIRQMEYDADRSSVRLTGYEAFESSLGKLQVLADALKKAFLQLKRQKQPTDSSLPNNFIKLILSVIQKISDEEIMKIKVAANKDVTGTRNKKLTVHERLEHAKTITTKPTFQSDQPATTLLVNFDDLALNATVRLYREVLGLQFEQSSLVPTDQFITSMELYETDKTPDTTNVSGTSRTIDAIELGDIIDSTDSDSNPFF